MRLTPRRLIVTAFFAIAVLVFGAPAAFAQGGVTATLSGTVTDTSGAVVPIATRPGGSPIVPPAATNVMTRFFRGSASTFTEAPWTIE